MREKKFGKRFLAWVLVLMMTLSLLHRYLWLICGMD